jgi:hypothetical protein
MSKMDCICLRNGGIFLPIVLKNNNLNMKLNRLIFWYGRFVIDELFEFGHVRGIELGD